MIAIENELGTDPAGSLSDVKTFLQLQHQSDGTHKSTHGPHAYIDEVNYTNFSAAVTAAANKTLVVARSINLDANTVIGATVSLMPLNPGIINANGFTLTINGSVVGKPMHQWLNGFVGNGDLLFGLGSTNGLNVRWFGAKGNNTTNDSPALNLAANVARASNDVVQMLIVPSGRYKILAPFEIKRISILGVGSSLYGTQFNVMEGFTGSHALILDGGTSGVNDGIYENFLIKGDEASQVVGGIKLSGLIFSSVFRTIGISYVKGDAVTFTGTPGLIPELTSWIGVHADVGNGHGLTMAAGRNNTFINCIWQGLDKNGINITSAVEQVNHTVFINNWVEDVCKVTNEAAVLVKNGDGNRFENLKILTYGTGAVACHGIKIDTSYRTTIDTPDIGAVTAGAATNYKVYVAGGNRNTFKNMPSNFLNTDLYALASEVHLIKSSVGLINSKGQIFVSNGTSILAGNTLYFGPPLGLGDANPDICKMLVSGYMQVLELRAVSSAPGAGETYTITVVQGTTPTALTVTLTNSAPEASNTSNEVNFVPGDYISFKVVASAGADSISVGRLKITVGYLI